MIFLPHFRDSFSFIKNCWIVFFVDNLLRFKNEPFVDEKMNYACKREEQNKKLAVKPSFCFLYSP